MRIVNLLSIVTIQVWLSQMKIISETNCIDWLLAVFLDFIGEPFFIGVFSPSKYLIERMFFETMMGLFESYGFFFLFW